ncbi:hypothetical protein Aph01nite_00700 [Acrocarpospora phusangensis]|uniref:Bacterial bifunctional deaminase-reductase C-terminal domain-containing protein n=1 Tax=Acrocarpospora phusangensis TaxID=1070424 RepID=A0A919Q7P9_9ACTN|nr:hypothetical protein Aph01nite_00700 [Acrocarpospora phusangensis]
MIQTLIQGDLVDECRFLVFPVVLGTGKRLFGDIIPTGLEPIDENAAEGLPSCPVPWR